MEGDTGMADRIAADVSGLALAIMTNRALFTVNSYMTACNMVYMICCVTLS